MAYPTLSIGSIGPYVSQLQGALNLGPSARAKLDTDGSFGPLTRSRVVEFQGQKGLLLDGVVGPNTWAALASLLALLAQLGGGQTPPPGGSTDPKAAKEEQARKRIVEEAHKALNNWGWISDVQLNPLSPRIAAARCADSKNPLRPRQGGAALTTIFTLAGAGAGKVALCPSIKSDIAQIYQSPPSAARTAKINQEDIGSWCGIFCFYVYKVSGLALGNWTDYATLLLKQGQAMTPGKHLEVVPFNGVVRKGDIGVLANKSNHHFVVTEDVTGESIKSIDGNVANPNPTQVAPWNSVIATRTGHTRTAIKNANGYFLRPIWPNLVGGW